MLVTRFVTVSFLFLGSYAFAAQSDYRVASPQPVLLPPVSPVASVVKVNPSKLLHITNSGRKSITGPRAVQEAEKRSIRQPNSAEAINSIIVFPYQPGDLYQIYTTPLNVTDVQLQAGEQVVSVAAGDTMRWEISKTVSGIDSSRVEHLLIKPLSEGLNTTMVVTTNWRTYHLLLKSTRNTFMAVVEWQYGGDQNMMMNNLVDKSASSNDSANIPVNLSKLNFSYRMKLVQGDKPDWTPMSIFNDGSKTYIEFPQNIQSAPTLFIKQSDSGDAAVNYRVVGNYYVVDQVFTAAELVSGNGLTVLEIFSGKNP